MRHVSLSSFQCSGGPQDLPSFPTRRSSDLGRIADDGRALKKARGDSAEEIGIAGVDPGEILAAKTDGLANLDDLGNAEATDRKSTRLNSSHVAISYAVFCLKKKNKRQDTET